ncbi:hypothetical protein B296_00059081 [Ensete ventricosum]|uniref:RRM domain-containing protein n=1 Tax=Ensete ventricosum TaxID=4639 RepID=A0A426XJ54_ENSVE|nr:hypothetical protein B296_00059081 [Ensete ventricosum]
MTCIVILGVSGYNGSSAQSDGDLTNTTVSKDAVFVGGLDPNVSEDDLKQTFSLYGEIASVKIPAGKQCGFVQFIQRYFLIFSFRKYDSNRK